MCYWSRQETQRDLKCEVFQSDNSHTQIDHFTNENLIQNGQIHDEICMPEYQWKTNCQ